MDRRRFAELFRETRLRRGLTQQEVASDSGVYEDERSIRRLESAQTLPPRHSIVPLVIKGLKERDTTVVNRFLEMAGYEALGNAELSAYGLTLARSVVETEPEAQPAAAAEPLNATLLTVWKLAIVVCATLGIGIAVFLRRPFLIVTALLYAVLYATSVLLESTYDDRGITTRLAALLSASIVWVTSLAALWAEIADPSFTALWLAITLIMGGAMGQWVVVRRALSELPNVPAGFQTLTGRTAHLKNTGYFLIFVFSFWALPIRCIACRGLPCEVHICPPILLLWCLLIGYFLVSLPMSHLLLSGLRAGPHFDRYLTLFLTRAILGLFLSLTCLLWYSSALAH